MIYFVNNGLFCEPKLQGELNKDKFFGRLKNKKDQKIFSQKSQILSTLEFNKHVIFYDKTKNGKD